MLDTNTCTFDTYSYSLISMLNVSASFTPSSGISTPRFITYLLTYGTEQSSSWEANRYAASQEIPRILWNPKVY